MGKGERLIEAAKRKRDRRDTKERNIERGSKSAVIAITMEISQQSQRAMRVVMEKTLLQTFLYICNRIVLSGHT